MLRHGCEYKSFERELVSGLRETLHGAMQRVLTDTTRPGPKYTESSALARTHTRTAADTTR